MVRAHWIHCCLVIVLAATAQGAMFFVDAEGGDDANAGTSASTPFLTIQNAVDQAAANPGPDLIQIAEGQYSENVVIDDADQLTLSGTRGVTVTGADAKQNVIYILSGEVTISDLTVTGGRTGIKAEGPEEDPATWTISLILRDVVVHNAGKNGVSADYVDSLTIVHGRFFANAEDGIKAEGANAVSVSGTVSEENGLVKVQDGADIEKVGTVRLEDVTIQGNGDDGLEVDFCGSITVIQGRYCGNGDDGLDIDNTGSISVVGVVALDNPGNGLQVESETTEDGAAVEIESISIRNCEFAGNTEDGVNIIAGVDGAVQQLALISITAEDNVQSGVEVAIGGSVKVSALKSANNGAPDVLP